MRLYTYRIVPTGTGPPTRRGAPITTMRGSALPPSVLRSSHLLVADESTDVSGAGGGAGAISSLGDLLDPPESQPTRRATPKRADKSIGNDGDEIMTGSG
jgi:hypothetical protein